MRRGYGHCAVASQSFGGKHILVVGRGKRALLFGRDTEGRVEIRHAVVEEEESAGKSNTGVLRLELIYATGVSHILAY